MASPTPLTGKQRRYLRALAHDLKPIVQIGHSGFTPGVVRELDATLETHELLKVRVGRECPVATKEVASAIEQATRSQVAQIVGRMLIVYRGRQKDPTIRLPQGHQD